MQQPQGMAQLSTQDWLAFSLLSGIGPARLARLCEYLSNPTLNNDLFDSPQHKPNTTTEIQYERLLQLKWPPITAQQAMDYLHHGRLTDDQQQKLEQTLLWLEEPDHQLILRTDRDYPELLKEISTAPALLYMQGQIDSLRLPKIGIVGARKCSAYGQQVTEQIASQLALRGISVVSGGAIGIDTAAHLGALNAHHAPTGVVMGTGLLHCYPKQNKHLFERVLDQQGYLLSEYPLTTAPRPHLFPPRNRIISGLSYGVLVSQASLKSGSLISANFALQQNREVFAIPARLSDSQSAGCHQLIRQGAILVRNADDIINECEALQYVEFTKGCQPIAQPQNSVPAISATPSSLATKPPDISSAAAELLQLISSSPQGLDFDVLIRTTNLQAPQLMQLLMALELAQCITNVGGCYRKKA